MKATGAATVCVRAIYPAVAPKVRRITQPYYRASFISTTGF